MLLTLVVLAVLAFTLQSLHTSGASYAVASSNGSNVFVSGTLSHVNDRNNQVMILATGLEPGGSKVVTMTLTGTGDVSGDYTLSSLSLVDTPTDPPLSGTLWLTIEDTTGTPDTLYDDLVSEFDTVDLGTIAPGETRSYAVTLAYPDGPDDGTLQGANMALTLQVSGASQ